MYRELINCGQGRFAESGVRVSLIPPSSLRRPFDVVPLYQLTDEELMRLDACVVRQEGA